MLTATQISRLRSFALLASFWSLALTGSLVPTTWAQSPASMATNLPAVSSSIVISGQIINAVTKAPIPRALVQMNERALLTDYEGRFQFNGIDTNSGKGTALNLRVTKPGYYASPEGDTTFTTNIAPDRTAAPVTIRLYPEAVLTGVLTAPDGTPLPRVLVTAHRSVYTETGHQWMPTGQHLTNSRGEFRLVIPPGDYRIETGFLLKLDGLAKCVIPSMYPATAASDASNLIHVASGTEERIDLHPELSATYPVTLRIEQTSERGVPTIMARSSSGAFIPANYTRTSSDGGGLIELPLGTYTLTANQNFGESREYGETTITVTGANTLPAHLRMAPLPPIPVEVLVDSGSTSDKVPPSAQQLGLILGPSHSVSDARSPSFGAVTSHDRTSSVRALPGSYRLLSVAGGPWFIRSATYGGADLLQQDLVVAQGSGSSSIRLTVSDRTGSLAGTVKLNGVPAAVWVYLIPSGPSAKLVYSMRSSPDGTFNLAFLPPGSYRAIAFELRHQDDYHSPERLARLSAWLHTVTVAVGNKASLELDAVPTAEMQP